ncbi:MAG: MMPL family transporter [Actinobacteria bacterium]|nr:MMPL family transporter [Actinomycetota bacterium]
MKTAEVEPKESPSPAPPRRTPWLRWVLPAAIVVVWIFVGGPLGSFTGQLASVQENDSLSFLPTSAESTEVAKIESEFQTSDAIPAIIVYEYPAEQSQQVLGAIAADKQQIEALPDVSSVAGPVPASDGSAATLIASVDPADEADIGPTVEEIRSILDQSLALALGASIYTTGPAGFLADFTEAFGEIDGLLLLVTLGVVLIILLIVYRSPILPIFVLMTSLLALGAAAAVIYALASANVITLNGQSQGILFILVIGATTDYSLLLVSRFREELRTHAQPFDAMKATLRGTYEAILASGGTVILGVLTLLLSELNSNKGLGPVAAIGILFAMIAALTFLPAVLLLLGRAAFWPARPKYADGQTQPGSGGLWTRVAELVGRRPRRIWISSLAGLIVLSLFLPMFKAEGVPQSDFFMTTVESTQGQAALERHFPGGSGSETVVVGPANDLAAMLDVIKANPGVASAAPLSGADGPVTVDGEVMVNVTLQDAADSIAAEQTVESLRTELDQVSDQALVGGPTATQVDTQASAQRDLFVIIPAVLVVTLLVLMLLLRAIVAPLLLIGTVIVSFSATLGLAAIFFYGILDLPGADPSVPLFAFVFLAALGIDYNIFLMTRAREESTKSGTRRGILKALAVTGGVITSAGIVLAATFGALAVLPLLFLFQIAFIVAVGVLIDTMIVRSLLVPAAVYELGDRSWWPSRLARRPEQAEDAQTDEDASIRT